MDTIKKTGLIALAVFIVAVSAIILTISALTGKGGEPVKEEQKTVKTTTTVTEPTQDEVVAPFEISISSGAPTIAVGDQTVLSAVLTPAQPRVQVCWYSENTDVVSITTDGIATGVSEGSAELKVVCISVDSENPEYLLPSATYSISVVAATGETGTQVLYDRPPKGNQDLIVVNTSSQLSASYNPRVKEVPESIPTTKVCYLTPEALQAYTEMLAAFKKANVGDVYIISAYRSYKKQSELFTEQIKIFTDQGYDEASAREAAMTTVNPPGCSEHQLGLSIDLSTDGTTQHDFGSLAQGKWFLNNAHRYGFILRYPADKVSITGIAYEPWHYRYVGVEHANYIYSHDLCLEEYVQLQ